MSTGRLGAGDTAIQPTILDAKGDLIVATAADTPARLAVGTNEHRLVAASGETTGLKYVADTTNYAIAAKGDLLVGTAADTLSALSVGTNGYTLVADSAETTGLKWAAAASGTAMGANVYNSTAQTVANSTDTILTFDSERFDTDSIHSTSTNTSRLTVPTGKGGKWLVAFNAVVAVLGTGTMRIRIKKNGTTYVGQMRQYGSSSYQHNLALAVPLDLAAADYVELEFWHNNGGNEDVYTSGEYGFFSMMRLGD